MRQLQSRAAWPDHALEKTDEAARGLGFAVQQAPAEVRQKAGFAEAVPFGGGQDSRKYQGHCCRQAVSATGRKNPSMPRTEQYSASRRGGRPRLLPGKKGRPFGNCGTGCSIGRPASGIARIGQGQMGPNKTLQFIKNNEGGGWHLLLPFYSHQCKGGPNFWNFPYFPGDRLAQCLD